MQRIKLYSQISTSLACLWRIFPNDPSELNVEEWGNINKYCQYWENSSTIRKRVEDLNKASAHIALFFEYIPHNLHEWRPAQIAKGNNAAESAVTFVDEHLVNGYANPRINGCRISR